VDVYLPEGQWVDFWTKQIQLGGKWIKVVAPLDHLPLWVRAGSIIPYGPEKEYVEQITEDVLTVEIYSPIGKCESIIEDENGQKIQVAYNQVGTKLTVKISQTLGEVILRIFGVKVDSASLDKGILNGYPCSNGFEVNFLSDSPKTLTFSTQGGEIEKI
jgi:alpha-glucosidase (family GH31 glycosyl hydrolase)